MSFFELACNVLMTFVWGLIAGYLFFMKPSYANVVNDFQLYRMFDDLQIHRIESWIFQCYNFIGYLWITDFIATTSRIIISRSIGVWYWTADKSIVDNTTVINSWRITLRLLINNIMMTD